MIISYLGITPKATKMHERLIMQVDGARENDLRKIPEMTGTVLNRTRPKKGANYYGSHARGGMIQHSFGQGVVTYSP